VNTKKIVTWVLVIFVVFYLLTDPNGAATFVSHAFNSLKSAGNSLSTFVSHL
jgi:predicted PurR-regulated permease PerM